MLTVEQVARRLGCSTNHARRLVRSGTITAVTIGLPGAKRQTIRIMEAELARFIESMTARPQPKPARRRRTPAGVKEYF